MKKISLSQIAEIEKFLTYESIVNNLIDGGTIKVLSAEQGKILKAELNAIKLILSSDDINLDTIQEIVDAIKNVEMSLDTILVNDLTTGGITKALTAEMGKSLKILVDSLATNKLDKGSYTGTAEDLNIEIQNLKNPDIVLKNVTPTISGLNISAPADSFEWRINQVVFDNTPALSAMLTPASDGFYRKDALLGTNTNTYLIIEGVEGDESVTPPTVFPTGTILLGVIDVFGNTVGGFSINDTSRTYVYGNGRVTDYVEVTKLGTTLEIMNASALTGFTIPAKNIQYGKDYYLRNSTGSGLILKSASGTNSIKFYFPQGDLIVPVNNTVHLKYLSNGEFGGLGYFTLVGIDYRNKADKPYVEDALDTKVDKVNGKSLISDSEITRLATVTNQDISGKANDIDVIHKTGNETKSGVLTLSDGLKLPNNTTSTTATKVNVQSTDGTINTISKSDLVNVVEVNDVPSLPLIGEAGKIYVVKNINKIYRWNGTIYQELAVTDITNNLTYINVKSFGAKGDGITDDTASIQFALNSIPSQGGTLYFPSGKYKTTGGLIITKPTNIIGDNGNHSYDYTAESFTETGSVIYSNSATNVLLSSSISGIKIQGVSLVNNSSSAVISGYGIELTNAGFISFENISVVGFYDNVSILNSGSSVINNCHFFNPIRYNVFMANPIVPDAGDNAISNCHFSSNSMGLVTNLKYESGGGLKITNTKFNPAEGGRAKIHIDANMRGGSTSILLVANSSFEGFTDSGIKITATAPITYDYISIQGSQFAAYTEMTGNYVQIMGEGLVRNVIVSNNIMVSTQTELERLPIRIDNVLTVIAKGNLFIGGSKGMYITNCTGVDTQEGDAGYIPKFKSNYAFVNSSIFSAEHGAGIGTETPLSVAGSSFFTVDGLNESGYIIRQNGVQSGLFSSDASGSILSETRNLPLNFYVNGSKRGAFSSSGFIVTNLSGTGDRNVVASADGTLKIGSADSRPYKVYTALLTQTGTNAPVATVLENTLGGTVVWTRNSTGRFKGTLSSAFTTNKTAVFFTSASGSDAASCGSANANEISLSIQNLVTGASQDQISGSIEIRVYN